MISRKLLMAISTSLLLSSACMTFDAPEPDFEEALLHNVILKGGNTEARSSAWVGWTNFGPTGNYHEEPAAKVWLWNSEGYSDTAVYDEKGFYYLDSIGELGQTFKVKIERPDGVFLDSLYLPEALELQVKQPFYVGSHLGDTAYLKYRTDVQLRNKDVQQRVFNLQLGFIFGSKNNLRSDYQSSNYKTIHLALAGADSSWPERGLFRLSLELGDIFQFSIYHRYEGDQFIVNTLSQSLFDFVLNKNGQGYNNGLLIPRIPYQDLGFAQTKGFFGWMHSDTIKAP